MVWKIELGTATLYGIRDGGALRNPLEYMIGSTEEAWAKYPQYLNDDGMMVNSFSCYLFDTGSTKVMIDTGFGANTPEGMDGGAMPAALESLGVAPTDIAHVVFTHLHPDHILGSLDGDFAPWFVDAAHWTLRREVAHWRAGTDERSMGIARVANALDDGGVLNAVEEPGQVIPGVDTIATYGHSPGHTAVRVSSGDNAVVIAGDITFTPAQIEYTTWAFPLDVDKDAAAVTRAAFFDMLAESGTPYVAGHYEQPGYGKVIVTSEGRRYEALPVEQV